MRIENVNETGTARHGLSSPYQPRLVAAGEIFDVLEVGADLGRATLDVLRGQGIALGPVIHDHRSGRIGFLVPPTATADAEPEHAEQEPRHHGLGTWITFPPSPCPPNSPLSWLVSPDWTAWHTTPLHLVRAAMERAAGHRPSDREREKEARPGSDRCLDLLIHAQARHTAHPAPSAESSEDPMALAAPASSHADAVMVRSGRPLMGVVRVDGSKNAALPLLAGAAALGRTVQVSGIPDSADVQSMLDLLGPCGYRVARPVNEPDTAIVLPQPRGIEDLPLPGAARIRASYYLVPALLATCGRANLPWPGGCTIGDRGMDLHFKVYEAFGDTTATGENGYCVTASTWSPREIRIDLPFRSRGATVVAVLRAVIGDHRLTLGNPNLSAETTALLDALTTAGWQIDARPEMLRVEPGATRVESVSWAVPGDKIEAGTLACAIAATGGCGRVEGVRGEDTAVAAGLLARLGVPVFVEPDALIVCEGSQPTSLPLEAVASLAPGGLDADFEPSLMALALGRHGTHLFADAINPGRHGNLLPQLARLGAHIEELTPTECRLTGPQRLTGAAVEATDIRTGSALLIAGLSARGHTTVTGLEQLRRGHADLPAKLRTLGADITEVTCR